MLICVILTQWKFEKERFMWSSVVRKSSLPGKGSNTDETEKGRKCGQLAEGSISSQINSARGTDGPNRY